MTQPEIHPGTLALLGLFREGIDLRQRGKGTRHISEHSADVLASLDDRSKGDVIIDLLGLYMQVEREMMRLEMEKVNGQG